MIKNIGICSVVNGEKKDQENKNYTARNDVWYVKIDCKEFI